MASTPDTRRALLAELLQQKASQPRTFPLSSSQQQAWLIERHEPGRFNLNICVAHRIAGSLDVEALERTFAEIVRRHETLRTVFSVSAAGQPQQTVLDHVSIPLSLIDLTHLAAPEQERRVQELAASEQRGPFDLSSGPLLRTTLVCLGPEEHVLIRCVHRLVADGWSLGVMAMESAALYNAFSVRKPSPLPELAIQYGDFVLDERRRLRKDGLREHIDYWIGEIFDAPSLIASVLDRPRASPPAMCGARHDFKLPAPLVSAMKDLSKREGVTLFMAMLTAFKVLMVRWTGQEDLIVGSPAANREQRELHGLIGLFGKILMLRTRLSGNPSYRESLRRVQQVAIDAYSHQDFHMDDLIEQMPDADADLVFELPCFVGFALHLLPLPAAKMNGLNIGLVKLHDTIGKLDLALQIWQVDADLVGEIEYNAAIFDATTIERLMSLYVATLETAVQDPDRRLADFPDARARLDGRD